MKPFSWQVLISISLIALSFILYFIHYLIFGDLHHIFIYLVGDIAFLPIEVLLVTLVLHRLLSEREKRIRHKNLNMVIGTFFSEVGTMLLKYLSSSDHYTSKLISNNIANKALLKKPDIKSPNIVFEKVNLEDLRKFLLDKRSFLLRLLENPNLIEHESFTELLWAVFHLTEELAARTQVKELLDADNKHISDDVKRAYYLLISEWVNYMNYLRGDYPYLYSFAVRTNPFNPNASPVFPEPKETTDHRRERP